MTTVAEKLIRLCRFVSADVGIRRVRFRRFIIGAPLSFVEDAFSIVGSPA